MSAHTPGPWDVSAKRKNLVIGARGHALADCKFSHSATNRQLPTASECIANARLIAAAPELLEALMSMVSGATANEAFISSNGENPRLKQARAAIAKAMGAA